MGYAHPYWILFISQKNIHAVEACALVCVSRPTIEHSAGFYMEIQNKASPEGDILQ
jgi:hypothetical protein